VHQESGGQAVTFWAGLGAVRRREFLAAGGFDDERYRTASIEDIELGIRLARSGARMRLDPDLQGTHLKRWTLRTMIDTDLRARGIPWVALLAQEKALPTGLNLGWRHRLSAAASVAFVAFAVAGRPKRAGAAAGALVALNAPFYGLLLRRRGPVQALAGIGLHALHHLTAVAAVPLGLVAHARERR
jgi:GT2 family glycosyltransferase